MTGGHVVFVPEHRIGARTRIVSEFRFEYDARTGTDTQSRDGGDDS
ncbi:hypothetical protein [Halorubrum amylolyticum]|nr:hypothetical protein [Halorubrum amylolyticum]